MKKLQRILAVTIVVASALASCTNDEKIQADETDYLYIKALNPNTIVQINKTRDVSDTLTSAFEYSLDKINWTRYSFGAIVDTTDHLKEYGYYVPIKCSFGERIVLAKPGDKVYFRAAGPGGKNGALGSTVDDDATRCNFYMSDKVEAGGNIMSLLDRTCMQKSLPDAAFYGLFSNTPIVSAPDLPATELSPACYNFLFYKCPNLEKAPALPARTMKNMCYCFMFLQCTSLTEAPELTSDELDEYCYYGMFECCEALTKAPSLPAQKLVPYCYSCMFQGCVNLTDAPELPSMELAENCYGEMFSGCEALAKAPALPALKLADGCYFAMFMNCTNLVQAPQLPAQEMTEYCYGYMYLGCGSLEQPQVLPAAKLAVGCYYGMFYGAKRTSDVTCLATDISAENCLYTWLTNCGTDAETRTLTVAPGMQETFSPYVPAGWTIVTAPQ